MKLETHCAMCGNEKEILIDTKAIDAKTTLAKIIEHSGWITQMNGVNFDVYCSKKCAR